MKKLVLLLVSVYFLFSCSRKEEYLVLQLQLDCAGLYTNELDNVLITDRNSDFGRSGARGSKYDALESLLAPKTIYKKHVKRHSDGYFYIDSVPKKEYFYFYVEGTVGDLYYWDIKRKNDFTTATGDTLRQRFCLKPGVESIQQSY